MSKQMIGSIIGIVLTAAVALLAVFGYDVVVVQPRQAAVLAEIERVAAAGGSRAVGDTNFTNVVTSGDLTVGDDATVTGDLAAGTVSSTGVIYTESTIGAEGTIAGQGMVTAVDGFATGGGIEYGLHKVSTPSNTKTVTMNGSVALASDVVPLTAAGAVSTATFTGGATGVTVLLYNLGANTITISDTGTLKLAGNAALGQYDSLTLYYDGTNWIEVDRSDN